jgi:aminopeptidase
VPDAGVGGNVFPDTLEASAARMTERRFDALHYEGPGTDLEIGLLRSSCWEEGRIGRLGRVFYDTLLDENAASAAHRCRLHDEQRPVAVGGDLPCPGGRAVNSRYRARP